MKNKSFLLALFIAFISFFPSCSNDDNENQSDEITIIGNWKTIREVEFDGEESTIYVGDECDIMGITFNADGTYILNDGMDSRGTYIYENETLVLTDCEWGNHPSVKLSANELILKWNNGYGGYLATYMVKLK